MGIYEEKKTNLKIQKQKKKKAPTCWFTLQLPVTSWAEPEDVNQEVKLGLPGVWQNPNYFRYHCCLPWCALAAHRNWGQSWNLIVCTLISSISMPSSTLTAAPQITPKFFFFKKIHSEALKTWNKSESYVSTCKNPLSSCVCA